MPAVASAPQRDSSPSPARKHRILVVDDHKVVIMGWRYLIAVEDDLEICGEAGTVAEALELLERTHPDIVVTDLALPGRNGLELVKEIHRLRPEIPVLVMSMFDEKLYGERVLKAGSLGYMMKEVAPDQLVDGVRKVLRGEHCISPALFELYVGGLVGGKFAKAKLPIDQFTYREMQIFNLIGQSWRQERIAKHLDIRPRTVEAHQANMRKKLGLANAKELYQYAVRYYESGKLVSHPSGPSPE